MSASSVDGPSSIVKRNRQWSASDASRTRWALDSSLWCPTIFRAKPRHRANPTNPAPPLEIRRVSSRRREYESGWSWWQSGLLVVYFDRPGYVFGMALIIAIFLLILLFGGLASQSILMDCGSSSPGSVVAWLRSAGPRSLVSLVADLEIDRIDLGVRVCPSTNFGSDAESTQAQFVWYILPGRDITAIDFFDAPRTVRTAPPSTKVECRRMLGLKSLELASS